MYTFSRPRLQRWWNLYQWLCIGGAWLVALSLGYIGFARYATSQGESPTPWDLLYLTLQLIPMNSGAVSGPVSWELNLARLLIPLLTAFTAVQAFAALFRQQADLVRLRFIRNHIVICGLSHKGLLLTGGFRERGDRVVVIEQNGSNALLEQCRIRGAILLIGDATDKEILLQAAVSRAKAIIAVCDEDGVNAEIALHAKEIVRDRTGTSLACMIHIIDPQLCSLLREREIEMEAGSAFRLELFNVYSRGAQLLLQDLPVFNAAGDKSHLHLVVIGLGLMGESLVANAARLWHANQGKAGKSLRITVVDREAIRKSNWLSVHYPRLKEHCELIPCEMDVLSPEFQSGNFLPGSQNLADVNFFVVCLDDDSLSLYTGLSLLRLTRPYEIPIIMRVAEIAGLARLLNEDHENRSVFSNLQPFGLLGRTCTPDLLLGGTHEVLAKAIHEEYVLRHKHLVKDLPGTDAMLPWENLPERLKESNRRQADHIGLKLKSVGCGIAPLTDWEATSFEFRPEEIERMAQMEHEDWMEDFRSDRWTYSVSAKDPDQKTHPDLVSWNELPEVEKEKNRGTVRDIPRFLARAGFQVERRRGVG